MVMIQWSNTELGHQSSEALFRPDTDEVYVELVRLIWKLQDQVDKMVPGLFYPLPDDDSNADAMRILSKARDA
jgi:hypothetical protein